MLCWNGLGLKMEEPIHRGNEDRKMESNLIISFEEFQKYCEDNEKKFNVTGQCHDCSVRSNCLFDNKEMQIDSLLHMNLDDSRFPLLLNFLQKRPEALYYFPAKIYYAIYGLYHKVFSCPFISNSIFNNLNNIETVYQMLTDEESKLTFLNVLMYRLTQNRDYALRAYSMTPQYFIPAFRGLGSGERYVDCGAYTGDSFKSYCQYNDIPKSAYLFEPDNNNRQNMKSNLCSYKSVSNIKIISKGVYKYSGELYFVERSGQGCHLSETPVNNAIKLSVVAIDDVIDEDISFIKMDIEGSEKEALIGAQRHISHSFPKLAICIYHKISDLWEIPLLVMKLFPEYNVFQLRHHTKHVFETVLYVYK